MASRTLPLRVPCGSVRAAVADRRFEAAIIDCAGTRLRDRADAHRIRGLAEELSRHGFDVYLVGQRGATLSWVDPDGAEFVEQCSAAGGVRSVVERLQLEGIRPHEIVIAGGGSADLAALLEDQLRRRRSGELPVVDPDPEWILTVEGFDRTRERAYETLLTLADGSIGTRAAPLVGDTITSPRVLAAGVYDDEGAQSHLLSCPVWGRLDPDAAAPQRLVRALDLRTGLLFEEDGDRIRGLRFLSVTRPGTAVLRAEEQESVQAAGDSPLLLPPPRKRVRSGRLDGTRWLSIAGAAGGVAAAAAEQVRQGAPRRIDRLAAYVSDPDRQPEPAAAVAKLRSAEHAGFERLLREQRRAWAGRWDAADIRIEGDPELQRDVRFALFHLLASVGESGETALGARGVSGPGYRGHVFWDADVFVIPFLAATRPQAARTLLEYRVRRLPAARAAARILGRAGARFPWESARTGREVTPSHAHLRSGEVVPIRTGELEEHIVADVAWGAACYLDWTGDTEFLQGAGRQLLVETARYWASRIRVDREGRGHIDCVIGPDEYHEAVDDNAFTNVMARWNLRRAAALPGLDDERERGSWLTLADALVDGYDERTGLYEQFAGFFGLEPLVIQEIAPRRPVAGELLLGRDRLRAAQVVKQADVLMLHHLVPGEVEPGSLEPNLGFYEPRTAHGSSLSPGVHAALFARAGMLEQAVDALRLTSRIDVDDVTETTASGLHIAAMGSVWQALVFGFAGVRPEGDLLRVDPRLPGGWRSLELRLRFRNVPLSVRVERDTLELRAQGSVRVLVGEGGAPVVVPESRAVRMVHSGNSWEEAQE